MKRFINLISIVALMLVVLSACNINVTPSATVMPIVTEPPTVATEASIATEVPTVAAAPTAELQTIDLAGPPMEVGSKYPYVDGTVLVAVPGGPFTMGYNSVDNPIHEVTLSEFWIYSTKVTNSQFALCVQSGKCSPPEAVNSPNYSNYRFINYPVTGVNYDQAAEYCTFVHGRLPSEAEWEKTARGPDGNIFPWGDGAPACDLLNYKFCTGKTTLINDYPKGVSYYSAFDMSGNTREWVADWYSLSYYSESPAADPLGPELGEKRSVRGSSYQDSADPSISAHRFSLKPTDNLPDLGFRCVVEDPTYFAPWCEALTYIGAGPLGEEANCSPEVKCNDISLSQAPNCTGAPGYIKYTIVTFNLASTPPDGWVYDAPGCSILGGGTSIQQKYQCDPGLVGPAKVEGSCVDLKSCVSTCPVHYNKVGDVCQWDGSGTIGKDCIVGAAYDPLTQCCSASPGSAVNFSVCPAGYYPVGGACVANPPKLEETIIQDVKFADKCSPPVKIGDCDPQTDPACQQSCGLDAATCKISGLEFDAGLCCCGVTPRVGPFVCR